MAPVHDQQLSQVIETYSARFSDPVARLKFLHLCAQVAEETPPLLGRPPLGRWGCRLIVLDSLCRTPGVFRESIPARDKFLLVLFRGWRAVARYVPLAAAATALALLIAGGVMTMRQNPEDADAASNSAARGGVANAAPVVERHNAPALLEVWLVETTKEGELYSNGLRVLDEYLNHSEPRSFPVFSRGPDGLPTLPQWRQKPVGIVFHTTVSDFAPPLERENNQLIRYRGQRLLSYISREQLYNFVIDRFGRVYRTVPENEFANHAGYSIWSEGGELYFNLNHSFLAVAFETRPEALDPNAPPEEAVTAAQVASARLLTQMLREKFGIVEGNCVTHELISVNPEKMLIGYHTDWKGRFPFSEIGLPDNYQLPLPSMVDWGFRYDTAFSKELDGKLWPGIRASSRQFEREAKSRDLSADRYRRLQQHEYKEFLARLREMEAPGSVGSSEKSAAVATSETVLPEKTSKTSADAAAGSQ